MINQSNVIYHAQREYAASLPTDPCVSATTVSLTRLTEEFARTSSLECIQRAQLSTRYIDSALVRAFLSLTLH